VPKPVLHLTSATCAILPIWLYVNGKSKALESAKLAVKAPAALVPKPAPMGTSTLWLTTTLQALAALLSSIRRAVFVVSASGANFPLMKTRIAFVFASETVTSVKTPFWIPKPPPLEPTRSKSAMGVPSAVLSQISKKLEIPAGEKAFAVVSGNYFAFFSVFSGRLRDGKAL
jgi:hypothetical protein